MSRLQDRVALITGASSGIGAACAQRFAAEGARVVGLDVNEPDPAFWKPIAAGASGMTFHRVDVRDEDAVAAAVNTAAKDFGRIDVVVNSAGTGGGGPVHLVATEEWDRVVDINLKGTFFVCKYVLAHMLERRSGSVINIASIEGIEGFEGGSAYNASKGGVVLLTRNIAIDYGRRGIRANAICPGFIKTPLADMIFSEALAEPLARIIDDTQLGRIGEPEEIAGAALFLASDDSSYMTGQELIVDGGFTSGHRAGVSKLLGLE